MRLLGYGALARSTATFGAVTGVLALAGLAATLAIPREAPRAADG